jgi:hypothetical protein
MRLSNALLLVSLLSNNKGWMQLQVSVNQVGPHDLVLRAQQLFYRTEQQLFSILKRLFQFRNTIPTLEF